MSENNNIDNEGMENITDIKRVTFILKCLMDLLDQERCLIKQMDIQAIEVLQEKKIPLVKWLNIFRNYVSTINPKFFQQIELKDRELFVSTYESFQTIAKENYDLLDQAILINRWALETASEQLRLQSITNVYDKNANLDGFSISNVNDHGAPIVIDLRA